MPENCQWHQNKVTEIMSTLARMEAVLQATHDQAVKTNGRVAALEVDVSMLKVHDAVTGQAIVVSVADRRDLHDRVDAIECGVGKLKDWRAGWRGVVAAIVAGAAIVAAVAGWGQYVAAHQASHVVEQGGK
jgi:hypothetical protein